MVTLLLALACADDDARSPDHTDEGDTAVEPTDEDGDGYATDVDCDDEDASVHPDADDACDGVDRNCDGAVVDEGGCGEVTEVEDADPVEVVRDYRYASLDCASNRDCVWTTSRGDIAVDSSSLEDWSGGGFAFYAWNGTTMSYALQLATQSAEVYVRASVVGDFDGDGTDDLALHGGSVSGLSELALISGDESRWPTGLTHVDDAAFAVWEALNGGDYFSEELDVGDVDGDGLVDIVTHAPSDVGEDNGGKSGWLFVLPGRTSGFPTPDDDRALTEEWYYPHSRDSVGRTPLDEAFSVQAVHPDLDGDGLADIIARGNTGWYAVVPGANLVSMRGAYIEDIVEYQSGASDYLSYTSPGSCSGMDFDDDGVMDCLYNTNLDDDSKYYLIVASGAGMAASQDIPAAALVMVGPVYGANAHLVRDVDLDGLADIGFTPDQGMGCLAVTSRLPLGGTVGPDEIAPCWSHDDEVSRIVDIAVGDFDGSGVPDVALSQQPYEDGDGMPIYLLFDLALPWDDPTRW